MAREMTFQPGLNSIAINGRMFNDQRVPSPAGPMRGSWLPCGSALINAAIGLANCSARSCRLLAEAPPTACCCAGADTAATNALLKSSTGARRRCCRWPGLRHVEVAFEPANVTPDLAQNGRPHQRPGKPRR